MLGFLFKSRASCLAPANEDPGPSEMMLLRQAMDEDFTDVVDLAHQMGLTVRRPTFCSEIAGSLTHCDGKWSIGVNDQHSANRQRFTIAHEIAHYLMHRDLILKHGPMAGVYDSCKYRQPLVALLNPHIEIKHERQASIMAAKTLMSEPKLRRMIDAGMSIFQIADRIGCSVGATKIRFGMLNLPLHGR